MLETRLSVWKCKQHLDGEEPVYEWEQNTQIGREREGEIGTKDVMFIMSRTTITKYNNQPFLKVTKSLYIVTILGQLPFTLFTEIAQTWAVQRDSVNTAIIHSYSTQMKPKN